MSSFRTDRRYYLNSEGKAVEEGDSDAQTLLFGMDAEVSAADAKKYGLKDPAAAQAAPAAEAEPEAESKSRTAPPANKAAAKASDK